MLAISTCWNYHPDRDIEEWLLTIKAIGFEAIELDYNITRQHLSQLPEFLKREKLLVSSVHNFCPTPDDGPSPRHKSNYYRLSSVDPKERAKAVHWTKATVDTAVRFGAKAVVLHAGAVEFEDERSTSLSDLYKSGKKESREFTVELERILENRRRNQKPYMEALTQSLEEIVSYSHPQGVVLGFESRYYPLEIPNFEEIGYCLDLFHAQGLSYWHDIGHSQMNEKLGITKNLEFLSAYSDRMIGMHIHDMKGVKDHHAPFSGEIGLEKFIPYFQKNLLNVFEIKNASKEELALSVKTFMKYLG